MNHAYKSVWNEATGTFVAVAENVNAKGKRSSSARKGGILAAIGALAIGASGAMAAITVDDSDNNKIIFETPNGAINFGSGGSITGVNSITGLADLTVSDGITTKNLTATGTVTANSLIVSGSLTADQMTVNTDANIAANSKQVVTGGQLFTEQGRITANKSSIDAMSTHEGRITTNTGNIATNTGNITKIDTALATLGVDTTLQGIKYFRVKSTKDDAIASGADSVAIGPLAVSSGANSLAAGLSAKATGANSLATGNEALASGKNSVASGNKAQATAENTVAVGNEALAQGKSTIALGDAAKVGTNSDSAAIGSGATVSGMDTTSALALGHKATASAASATAIGKDANASGGNAIAFGSNATASGASGIAMGQGAQALAKDNISIGRGAGEGTNAVIAGDHVENIAIGTSSGSNVVGQTNAALGFQAGQQVKGNNNVAFGAKAGIGVKGDENISIGSEANKGLTAERAVGIGFKTQAETEGIAIGSKASVGSRGVAVGSDSLVLGTGTAIGSNTRADSNFVALGLDSIAIAGDVNGKSGYLTNSSFSGSAVSVGSSATGLTRRIVNVEDGANDTDAVNVQQLKLAVKGIDLSDIKYADEIIGEIQKQIKDNKIEYVSVNEGGASQGNKDNTGAQAANSIAIGPDAVVTTAGSNATAIGVKVEAQAESAVVLGHNIRGLGKNSTTIGNSGSEARDEGGVAIGTAVKSRDENSIVIGRGSETDRQGNDGPSVKNSIVIGTTSKSTAEEGIVLGKDSLVNARKGIAQGSNAQATAESAMAFGTGSRASAIDSQASGTGATAYAERGVALGKGAVSGQANPQPADREHNRDSIAIGTGATAEMNSSIATGNGARATANYSQASGYKAEATGINSIAQGSEAKASAKDAIAIGAKSEAARAGSVALGANSKTLDGATKEASAALNNLTYGGFAGQVTDPGMQVSVGSKGAERQIKHVGAGKISAESTDAINGSQLFATNTVLGNVANTTKTILGGNAALNPNGSLTMTNIGDTNKNTVHEAIKYAAQGWFVQTDTAGTPSNVKPGDLLKIKGDGNINVTNTGNDLLVALNKDLTVGNATQPGTITVKGESGKDGVSINGKDGTIGLAGKNGAAGTIGVVNGAPGVDGLPGVTRIEIGGKQVATLEDGLKFKGNNTDGVTVNKKLNETLTVKGALANGKDASGANLRVDVADGNLNLVMAKNLTDLDSITINNGPVISGTGVDMKGTTISNLKDGVNGKDAVNVDQLGKVSDVANAGWNVATSNTTGITTSNVAPKATVDFVSADDSIVVEHTRDAVGNTSIDFALGNNLNVGGLGKDGLPGKNGFIGVNGADGKTGVAINGKDGTIGLTGPTGASGTIGVINGTPGVDGKNGITRIVIEGNEVATMKDGLKFAGNKGATINKQLNETLSIEGGLANSAGASGANLRVDSKDGKLNLVMAKNLTDLNSITINKGGPIINVAGIDMNNKTISNLKDGVDGKDAVNVDQLNAVNDTAKAGWNVATSNTTGITTSNVAPKATVDFVSSDKNVVIEHTRDADGNTSIDYKLNPNINLTKDGSVTTGNSVLNNAGLAVVDVDSGKSTKVTVDGVEVEDEDGNSAIYAADQTVLSNGGLVTTINAGMLSVTNGVHTSTFGPTQIVVGGANSITMNGDAGTINGLTNKNFDPDKFTSGQAATEDQLKQVSDVANAGWNVSTNKGDVVANVGPSATVDFNNTDGNITIAQNGTDLEFNLKKDIDLGADGSVTTGNSVLDNDGLAVDDGAGNSTKVTTGGVEIADAAGNTTSIEAGELTVSDGTNTSTFGPTQIVAGGANEVTIDGAKGTISGLTNKTFDPDNFTSGQAATEDQLKNVSDVANAGWNVTTNGDPLSKENVAPDATVDFNNTDGNIVIGQAGTNLEFNLNKDIDLGADGSVTTGDTVMNNNGITIVGGPSITKNGIDAGGNKVTGVKDGEIAAGSTDAVNGSQLNDTNNRVTVNEGNITNLQTGKEGMFQVSQDYTAPAPKPTGTKSVAGGAGAIASGNNSTAIGNDAKATANNTTSLGNGASASHNNSVALGYGSTTTREDSVSVGSVGGERQITNVAAGTAPTDAVNVSQLDALGGQVSQYFNMTNKRIDRVDNNARAGIAGAVAAGSLPQSTLPGKSMLTLGGATYRGETALAIGVSRLSDNSRTVIKVNGTADSRGNASVGVGAGWHW